MMRSMVSASSALRFHQMFMDVVANNLANVNTTAYKGSRMSFHELMSQVMSAGSGPQGDRGGINPVQVGLGVVLGGTDTMFTQGMLQATGRSSDLAIQGDGFFIFRNPAGGNLYSRDGALDLGLDGSLVNPSTGFKVMGWPVGANNTIDTTGAIQELNISVGEGLTARQTSEARVTGNLSASTADADTVQMTVQVFDSLGVAHNLTMTFTRSLGVGANGWTWAVASTDPAITGIADPDGQPDEFIFDGATGQYAAGNNPVAFELTLDNGATSPLTVNVDLSQLTQLEADSNVNVTYQDGLAAGSLINFSVAANGDVVGVNSNGMRQILGRVAMATFLNPTGLLKAGDNMFEASTNSGDPAIGTPGTGQRGAISAGFLEMSNVELSQQFTDMIRAQRGFQANSRVISASDQMLQDLVGLIR